MPDRQNDVGNPDRRIQIECCLDLEQHRSRVECTNIGHLPEFTALPESSEMQFARKPQLQFLPALFRGGLTSVCRNRNPESTAAICKLDVVAEQAQVFAVALVVK